MFQIDYKHPLPVHFIGIGGISMSGLACILKNAGFPVTGSDSKASELTARLEAEGIPVYIGQKPENIPSSCSLVVYTAAVHKDNPEYQEAQRRNIPMLTRAQLLGELMHNYPVAAAIAGTHGKTTTTSMLAHISMEAGQDPTISVGGMLPLIGGNIRVSRSETFITEACEYTNSFLSFYPTIAVVLNIDEDHLDFFRDLEDIRSSFRNFMQLVPQDGVVIINGSIEGLDELTEGLPCRIITFGTPGSDYYAENILHEAQEETSFDLKVRSDPSVCERFTIHVPGSHNILNALAAIAAADFMGASREAQKKGLSSFTGTQRRFEIKGKLGGVTVIDDYAHHPTEIRATLQAALVMPHREVWCVFQSHTYSRTKALFDDFISALSMADHVVLAEIYPARETDTLGMSGSLLCSRLRENGNDAYFFPTFSEIEEFVKNRCKDGDLLITMGAGDVYKVGEDLLKLK